MSSARNKDIMMMFLLHAGLIGFIGGLIGVIFGIMLSGFLPTLMGRSGGFLSRMGSGGALIIGTMIGALLVSVLIGMAAGAIPAYQASKLRPVDALRYE